MTSVWLFIVACILIIILPGPDTAVVTKNTIVHGKKQGLQTMFGICLGLLLHTAMCVAGLSALIVKSAVAFTVLKVVGAIYLVYLGVKTLWAMRAKKSDIDVETLVVPKGNSSFRQGFITNITNPKVAVFFLTFMPQFLATDSNPFLAFSAMGIIYAALSFVWFIFYVYLLNHIRSFMQRPVTQAVTEGLTGLVLIGFGIKLAFEKA